MTIARAIKNKENLLKKIDTSKDELIELFNELNRHNSWNKLRDPLLPKNKLIELNEKMKDIIQLKSNIHISSIKKIELIFEMGELKNEMTLLTKLYESVEEKELKNANDYLHTINLKEIDLMLSKCQKRYDELKRNVDYYNYNSNLKKENKKL
jgi:hypothetical protein